MKKPELFAVITFVEGFIERVRVFDDNKDLMDLDTAQNYMVKDFVNFAKDLFSAKELIGYTLNYKKSLEPNYYYYLDDGTDNDFYAHEKRIVYRNNHYSVESALFRIRDEEEIDVEESLIRPNVLYAIEDTNTHTFIFNARSGAYKLYEDVMIKLYNLRKANGDHYRLVRYELKDE